MPSPKSPVGGIRADLPPVAGIEQDDTAVTNADDYWGDDWALLLCADVSTTAAKPGRAGAGRKIDVRVAASQMVAPTAEVHFIETVANIALVYLPRA
jgi:hypothetical protein